MSPFISRSLSITHVLAWTPLKFKSLLKSFRISHNVFLNVTLYASYELNGVKLTVFLSSFVKRISLQNDIQDYVMRDEKLSAMSHKFKWRLQLAVSPGNGATHGRSENLKLFPPEMPKMGSKVAWHCNVLYYGMESREFVSRDISTRSTGQISRLCN